MNKKEDKKTITLDEFLGKNPNYFNALIAVMANRQKIRNQIIKNEISKEDSEFKLSQLDKIEEEIKKRIKSQRENN